MTGLRRVSILAALLLAGVKLVSAQGAAFGSSNARRLNGIPLSTTAPTNGQTWVYNGTTRQWEPGSAGGGVTLQANGTPQATAPTLNILPGTGVQLLVGGNSTALTLQPVLDAQTGVIDMPPGGCFSGGPGTGPRWGIINGSTASIVCSGGSQSMALLAFPNAGTPQAVFYGRLPMDWTNSNNSLVIQTANNSGTSGTVKLDSKMKCLHAGDASNALPAWGTLASQSESESSANTFASPLTYPGMDVTGCSAGDFFVVLLQRDASVGGNSTGNAYVASAQWRYTRQ